MIAILSPLISDVLGGPREVGNKQVYDCAVNYLRTDDSLDKHFKYTPNVTDDSDCDVMIALIYDKIHAYLKALFDEDKDFADRSDCIVEKLKTFNVGDVYIEKFVYNQDRTMSKLRRQRAVSDAIAIIELKLELAEEICVPEKLFSDWFDELYGENTAESNSTEVEDDIGDLQEDYCQRRLMIEKKFIDLSVYNVTVNPSNISTEGLNCQKHWLETAEEYGSGLKDEIVIGLDDPSKKETRCIAEKIRNGNYTEQLLKVWMLSEVKLSEPQKTFERTNFIDYMKKLYADLMTCQECDEEDDESKEVNSVENPDFVFKNIEFKNLF